MRSPCLAEPARLWAFATLLGCLAPLPPTASGDPPQDDPRAHARTVDLAIWDSTPAGIAAAIEARRHGLEVLLLSPYAHLGGLTTSGLGATDVGNPEAIGGLGREFYLRLAAHYAAAAAPREQRELEPCFHFEPSVAETVLESWLQQERVETWRGVELSGLELQSLDGASGRTTNTRISTILLADGRSVEPKAVIDASYEGDLLPLAKVPFTVGREANSTYGETLNGAQFSRAVHHQFGSRIDAYRIAGDLDSGLLPELDPSPRIPDGDADDRLQAYCFRLCLTQEPGNRRPFESPPGYQRERYELLLRWFDAGADWLPLHPVAVPNGKTDTNNNGPVSSDWIGGNRDWLEASPDGRREIAEQHRNWQTGLLWTLVQDPRVPEAVRREAAQWGLAKDEFTDNDNWPYRLYVREGRRLVGDLVIEEAHCRGLRTAPEPVALAAYTMDSHHVRRLVDDGQVWNEGDVQVGGFPPYPIGYRALLPPKGSVVNLAVPVCLSASHIAYGSIRMEPVFFCLGHAAGAAAALAAPTGGDLTQVDYQRLRELLLAEGASLEGSPARSSEPPGGIPVASLGPFVVDDEQATFEGPWAFSRASAAFVGTGYRHDDAAGGGRRAELGLDLPAGRFELELGFPASANRATRVQITVRTATGARELELDQRHGAAQGLTWAALGRVELGSPGRVRVELNNEGADGYVVLDALRARPVEGPP